jgi:hypothetical protein
MTYFVKVRSPEYTQVTRQSSSGWPWKGIADMAKSFWNIPTEKDVKTPYDILLEQANALTESSKGRLRGVVDRSTAGNRIANILKVVVPKLNGYTFEVVQLWHEAQPYPLTVFVPWGNHSMYEIRNEADLCNELEKLITAEEVQKVIRGLWAQVS